MEQGTSILRDTALRYIHISHYLNTRDNIRLEFFGNINRDFYKTAIHTNPYSHLSIRRFDMDITGFIGNGSFQNGIHEFYSRCCCFLILCFLFCGHLANRQSTFFTHLLDRIGSTFVLINNRECSGDHGRIGNHGSNLLTGYFLRFFNRTEIQRIFHRNKETVSFELNRYNTVIYSYRLGNICRHLRRNCHLVQINLINTKLCLQRSNQLFLSYISLINQNRAESLAGTTLFREGII